VYVCFSHERFSVLTIYGITASCVDGLGSHNRSYTGGLAHMTDAHVMRGATWLLWRGLYPAEDIQDVFQAPTHRSSVKRSFPSFRSYQLFHRPRRHVRTRLQTSPALSPSSCGDGKRSSSTVYSLTHEANSSYLLSPHTSLLCTSLPLQYRQHRLQNSSRHHLLQ
jgi:hypothetical protein